MMKNPDLHKPALGVNRIPPVLPSVVAWLGVLGWVAGVCWLSSLSGPEVARMNVWNVWDKASHFGAFAMGGGLLAAALSLSMSWPARRVWAVAWLAISLFAGLDELHQIYTPKRSGADPGDWLADTLGAVAGIGLARGIYVRAQRKNRGTPPGD
jgi:VanZ family protein